jgi:hypothetical protein
MSVPEIKGRKQVNGNDFYPVLKEIMLVYIHKMREEELLFRLI